MREYEYLSYSHSRASGSSSPCFFPSAHCTVPLPSLPSLPCAEREYDVGTSRFLSDPGRTHSSPYSSNPHFPLFFFSATSIHPIVSSRTLRDVLRSSGWVWPISSSPFISCSLFSLFLIILFFITALRRPFGFASSAVRGRFSRLSFAL